eukprot:1142960-Pelagomonas_calceolata.AAC.1
MQQVCFDPGFTAAAAWGGGSGSAGSTVGLASARGCTGLRAGGIGLGFVGGRRFLEQEVTFWRYGVCSQGGVQDVGGEGECCQVPHRHGLQ